MDTPPSFKYVEGVDTMNTTKQAVRHNTGGLVFRCISCGHGSTLDTSKALEQTIRDEYRVFYHRRRCTMLQSSKLVYALSIHWAIYGLSFAPVVHLARCRLSNSSIAPVSQMRAQQKLDSMYDYLVKIISLRCLNSGQFWLLYRFTEFERPILSSKTSEG